MSRTCVVVADRVRARFFVIDPSNRPAGEPRKLREVEALTDSEGALKGNDTFSNRRSGTNRSPVGGQFEYDDHRGGHRQELERRFAKRIVEAIKAIVRSRATEALVLAAEPRMLGLLRSEMDATSLGGALGAPDSHHAPRRAVRLVVTEPGAGTLIAQIPRTDCEETILVGVAVGELPHALAQRAIRRIAALEHAGDSLKETIVLTAASSDGSIRSVRQLIANSALAHAPSTGPASLTFVVPSGASAELRHDLLGSVGALVADPRSAAVNIIVRVARAEQTN